MLLLCDASVFPTSSKTTELAKRIQKAEDILGIEASELQEEQSGAKNVRTRLADLESDNKAKAEELRRLKAQVKKIYT